MSRECCFTIPKGIIGEEEYNMGIERGDNLIVIRFPFSYYQSLEDKMIIDRINDLCHIAVEECETTTIGREYVEPLLDLIGGDLDSEESLAVALEAAKSLNEPIFVTIG